MMFGQRTVSKDSYSIIDHVHAGGFDFIDTASVRSRSGSEEVVGEAQRKTDLCSVDHEGFVGTWRTRTWNTSTR